MVARETSSFQNTEKDIQFNNSLPASTLYSQVYGCGISRIKGINCNKKIRNYSVFELFARLEFFSAVTVGTKYLTHQI